MRISANLLFKFFCRDVCKLSGAADPCQPGLSAQYLEVSVRGKLTKFKVGSRRDLWGEDRKWEAKKGRGEGKSKVGGR